VADFGAAAEENGTTKANSDIFKQLRHTEPLKRRSVSIERRAGTARVGITATGDIGFLIGRL
ncbi:MAG: hypothetical protein ACI93T_003330, partial [Porticoccaceae bacterium]